MNHRPAQQSRTWYCFLACVVLLASPSWADPPAAAAPKVQKILFLGNSITLHAPLIERGWKGNWGMAASALEKDYVHLVTQAIHEQTGSKLGLSLVDPTRKTPDGTPPLGDANVVNIADILERNYAAYDAAQLRAQVAAGPDLVVLQFGENVQMDSFDAEAFSKAVQTLVSDLKASSNPLIFVTSTIYGAKPALDRIKQQIVAADPARRVFVDLSGFGAVAGNNGFLDHPSDQGMKYIADALYGAIRTRLPARRETKAD